MKQQLLDLSAQTAARQETVMLELQKAKLQKELDLQVTTHSQFGTVLPFVHPTGSWCDGHHAHHVQHIQSSALSAKS